MVRAALSLDIALGQLNALAPNRAKASDGGIASSAHSRANPTSDHEADASGTYHARDFTHDPANGANMSLYPMRLIADRRAKYVIFNDIFYDRNATGHIRVRSYPLVNPKRTNKHDKHLHLSVHGGALGEDGRQWEAFTQSYTPPVVVPPKPVSPPVYVPPAFVLPRGHYYGHIAGPARSHGGFYVSERGPVRAIQRACQRLGYAPSYASWADGKFETPTVNSVAAFQRAHMPGTQFYGQVWADDWRKLFTLAPYLP